MYIYLVDVSGYMSGAMFIISLATSPFVSFLFFVFYIYCYKNTKVESSYFFYAPSELIPGVIIAFINSLLFYYGIFVAYDQEFSFEIIQVLFSFPFFAFMAAIASSVWGILLFEFVVVAQRFIQQWGRK